MDEERRISRVVLFLKAHTKFKRGVRVNQPKKKLSAIFLSFILVMSMFSVASAADKPKGTIVDAEMEYDGLQRTYKYYVPSTYKGKKAVPLMSLIDHFSEEYNIDQSRVYATGMSYGG